MDQGMNRDQIAQFSKRDAERFEEYEAVLSKFVEAVDPLLDTHPPRVSNEKIGLLQFLREVRPLLMSGKTLGADVNQVKWQGHIHQ